MLSNNLILPTLTPMTGIFGFLDSANNDSIFENKNALVISFFKYLSYMRTGQEKKVHKYKQSHS